MSDSNITPSSGTGADDGSHLTVEDSGSTTDPIDLGRNEDRTASTASVGSTRSDSAGAPAAGSDSTSDAGEAGAPAPPVSGEAATTGGIGDLDDVGHVFDQTNGVIEGLDGDSDGSADSDSRSSAERADENPAFENFADTEVEGDGEDTTRTGS